MIGLFFGSFNPIHTGHLIIAEYMHEHAQLDQVWFIVSPQNPLKEKDSLLKDDIRLKMVKLAIKDNKNFSASDIEFKLPKPSYTVNTLEAIRKKFPKKKAEELNQDLEKILIRAVTPLHPYSMLAQAMMIQVWEVSQRYQIAKIKLLINKTRKGEMLKEHEGPGAGQKISIE